MSFSETLRPMPDGDDRVEHAEVVARGGMGLLERGDALAEVVQCLRQPARLDGSRRRDGFVERFAGDEPAREAVGCAIP